MDIEKTSLLGLQACGLALKHKKFNNGQIYAMMAIIIAGIASFVGLYTAASGIDQNELNAEDANQDLKNERDKQYKIMLILGILAIVFGWIAAKLLKNSVWMYIPVAIVATGFLGVFYSVGIKLRSNKGAKIGLSVALFIIALIYVVYVGVKTKHSSS